MLDVVNTIQSDSVLITLYDSQKSILISAVEEKDVRTICSDADDSIN